MNKRDFALNQSGLSANCFICGSITDEPRLLCCLHGTCLSCACRLAGSDKKAITCPLCSYVTPLTEITIECLPIDFVKKRLANSVSIADPSKCSECGEKTALKVCKFCSIDLCDFCAAIHASQSNSNQHIIEPRTSKQTTATRPTYNCSVHPNDRLRFYCTEERCSKAVCSECLLTGDHKGHSYVELHESVDTLKRSYEKMLKHASKVPSALEKLGNGLDLLCNQIESKSDAIELQINALFGSLRQVLEQRQQQLLNKLQMIKNAKLLEAQQQKQQLFNNLMLVQHTIDYSQNLLQTGDYFEMMPCKPVIYNRLRQLKRAHEKLPKLSVVDISFSMPSAEKQQQLFNMAASLCQLNDLTQSACAVHSTLTFDAIKRPIASDQPVTGIIKTFSPNAQSCTEGGALIEARIEPVLIAETISDIGSLLIDGNVQSLNPTAPVVQLTDNKDGSYALSLVAHTAGRYRLRVHIEHQPIATSPLDVFVAGPKRDYSQLSPANAKTIVLRGAETTASRYPAGVFCDTHANVLFTDNKAHSIHILDRSGVMVRTITGDGTDEGKLKYPYGIAASLDGQVFVVEAESARLQVFNYDGKFIRRFGSHGSAAGQFSHPLGLTIDRDARLLVSDGGGNRIQVFGVDGSAQCRFGSFGNGDGQFNRPIGLAVNCNDQIIIGDSGNCRVQVILFDGSFVKKFGSKLTSTTKPTTPTVGLFSGSNLNVAVDAYDQIFVSDSGGDSIQIFDNQFNLVQTFNQFCKIQKKLSLPNGVAIDIFGRLIVCDQANNRLHIL